MIRGKKAKMIKRRSEICSPAGFKDREEARSPGTWVLPSLEDEKDKKIDSPPKF